MTFGYFIAIVALLLNISPNYVHLTTEADLYGSICRLKDGTFGVCKAHSQCKWAWEGYKDGKISYADIVRCTFVGTTEIICCGDERPRENDFTSPSTVSINRNDEDMIYFFSPNNDNNEINHNDSGGTDSSIFTTSPRTRIEGKLRKCEEACQRFMEKYQTLTFQILGGEETSPGDFPHMAALGYPSEEVGDDAYLWNCGGTLISEEYVLTAAHCVSNPTARPTIIRLGKVTLRSNDDTVTAQDIGISKIIIHPLYKSSRNYHDIALIKLAHPAEMNDNVKPACLSTAPGDAPEDTYLIVTGWGSTSVERREKSGVLLKTNLTSVPLDKCNRTFTDLPPTRHLPNGLNEGQLCAFDVARKKDACEGDSGGPLQTIGESGFATIIGVTSFGISCASSTPGVYARVSYYLDFIETNVWPDSR
ncbi:serine protease persephone-like isoform X2 [Lutzomyia longipalpis]|uniref:serine protease persephone-like isoform X2 n=1 Tax=Lutzomyia longipalpis TaxID=7200 RepID=UPI00248444EA|nr:serine protease persephone-like isoform X2 [Lutzomyia longipalpis]